MSKVTVLCFSQSGILASGSRDKTVIIWNLKEGKPNLEPFKGHKESIKCLAFSYKEEWIASGSKDFSIILWNANNGKMEKSFDGHSDTVMCVEFSENGRNICSGKYLGLNANIICFISIFPCFIYLNFGYWFYLISICYENI